MIRVDHRLALPRLSLVRRLRQWHALSRQRRDLSRLDADALRDIGISPRDARREAERPFWDAPDNWFT